MADETVDFASLMCSRLCHDLLSPVGAFGNGLELLADEQDEAMRQSCVDLLEASAHSAIAKLKFFRLAFGSAGGYGEVIGSADLREAVAGLVPGGREITLNWIGLDEGVPKAAARILLLLAQVVVESLVRGGALDLAVEQRGDALELAVRGAGPRVVIDETLVGAFSGSDVLTPKTVGVALARRLAREGRGEIMLSRPSDGELVVGAIVSG